MGNVIKTGLMIACFLAGVSACNRAYPSWADVALLGLLSPGGTIPTVSETVPAAGATGIFTNTSVSITFSVAMEPQTITTNTADTGCSGALQLSADNFTTCVQMNASPASASGNTVFSLKPAAFLAATTAYKVRVLTGAKSAAGVALAETFTMSSAFTTGAGADLVPPTVSSTSPADAATAVAGATSISVTFSEGMLAATLTTNTGGTTCSGSLQVSADNFVSCVQMSAQPAPTVGNTVFTVTPASALTGGATFKIRITTGVTDLAGNALAALYTTATGFTTGDTTPPTVVSTDPTDGATGISRTSATQVTFSEPMNTGTITAKTTAGGPCTGTIQVSSSAAFGAGTCVQFAALPVASNSNRTFTIVPFGSMAPNQTYYIRVTTAVQDAAGNALAAQYTQATGFGTQAGNDSTAPTVSSTNPADTQTGVAATTTITVTFNEAMRGNTITTNTGGSTACSGTHQVSLNGFVTCVPMATSPTSAGAGVYLLTPAVPLAPGTYQIRITTAVLDASGNALAVQYTTATGFTTP